MPLHPELRSPRPKDGASRPSNFLLLSVGTANSFCFLEIGALAPTYAGETKRGFSPEENFIPPTAKSENKKESGPLPEIIPVKYTEEEAEYLSMRPLVRQEFRSAELVDMIVQVAGKDPGRVQKILSAGTIVFHSFRYWWAGFEADAAALSEILKKYPDADPQRTFRAEDCTEVILESRSLPAAAGLPTVTESGRRGDRLASHVELSRNLARFHLPDRPHQRQLARSGIAGATLAAHPPRRSQQAQAASLAFGLGHINEPRARVRSGLSRIFLLAAR